MENARYVGQDENASALVGGRFHGATGGGSFGPAKGLAAARQPLASIKNVGNTDGPFASAKAQAAGPLARRRVLGDITNGPRLEGAVANVPAQGSCGAASAAKPQPKSLAEQYAAEGVERLAGRGWMEQEQDALANSLFYLEERMDSTISKLGPSGSAPSWALQSMATGDGEWALDALVDPALSPTSSGALGLHRTSCQSCLGALLKGWDLNNVKSRGDVARLSEL